MMTLYMKNENIRGGASLYCRTSILAMVKFELQNNRYSRSEAIYESGAQWRIKWGLDIESWGVIGREIIFKAKCLDEIM